MPLQSPSQSPPLLPSPIAISSLLPSPVAIVIAVSSSSLSL
jgi:hypothetical protein